MNFNSYFKKLFFVTVALSILVWLLNQTEIFSPVQTFIWISLAFFFLISCGVYLLASRGIATDSSYRFTAMVSGSFTGKLLLCVAFILLYVVVAKPQGKPFFIIPFFVFYIVFTVLEVVELIKLNKVKSKSSKH